MLVFKYNAVMNKQFAFTNKKTKIASGVAVGVIALATAVSFMPRTANGDFSLTDLNQQVQNHEARLTNTENDVKKLQDNTNTAPADHVAVPTAPTPGASTPPASSGSGGSSTSPSPSPATPPPVSLVKTVNQSDTCENGQAYTHRMEYYSDGSSKQFDQGPYGSCVTIGN